MKKTFIVLSIAMVTACGGGSIEPPPAPTYSVGGNISGLGAETGLTLVNGTETLTIAANAKTFNFSTKLFDGTKYSVVVGNQPTKLTCTVTAGTGVIDGSNMSAVAVDCVPRRLTVTTLAGNGTSGFADGMGASARFNLPRGVAVDSMGNVYVADGGNEAVRKISPIGVVSTLAKGPQGFTNGAGTPATSFNPRNIAVDSIGNVYVSDGYTAIRKISPAGVVTAFAGSGVEGFDDGVGASASFRYISGITIDQAGNLYVADTYNYAVRKVSPLGVVTTVTGRAERKSITDGPVEVATFHGPTGIAVDNAGNLYITDLMPFTWDFYHRTVYICDIRKISSSGMVTTLIRPGGSGFAEGTGDEAKFSYAGAIAVDNAGNLYVADSTNNAISKITPALVVTTLAGRYSGGYADGDDSGALFNFPSGIAVNSAGTIYIADPGNHAIRKGTPYPASNFSR